MNVLLVWFFLSSRLLTCFDISLFDRHELLSDDWQFDSSCDWPTGPAERINVFICFTAIKTTRVGFLLFELMLAVLSDP